MDGFVRVTTPHQRPCTDPNDPTCVAAGSAIDVMGYHTRTRHPELLDVREDFVLQDHMFEPDSSWSLPAHLFMVSEWSATAPATTTRTRAPTCSRRPARNHPPATRCIRAAITARSTRGPTSPTCCTRTSVVGLLRLARRRTRLRERRDQLPARQPERTERPGYGIRCRTSTPSATTIRPATSNRSKISTTPRSAAICRRCRGSFRPAPSANIRRHGSVTASPTSRASSTRSCAAPTGTRPRSSWPGTTGAASTITSSPPRRPQRIRAAGPGPRHQPLRQEGLHRPPGAQFRRVRQVHRGRFPRRCTPRSPTDGRPDPRPTVRENVPILGNLTNDFDFNQAPRPAVILPVHPNTTLVG